MKNLDEAREECAEKEEYSKALNIKNTVRTISEENTLNFLSKGNIIPKYGFPVDTVRLKRNPFDFNDPYGEFDLQRDLVQAITDYAPGCQVVADKKLITSGYLLKNPGMELERFAYGRCQKCGALTVERFVNYDSRPSTIKCSNIDCKAPIKQKENNTNAYIIPRFGFMISKIEDATISKPRRALGRTLEYKGNRDRHPEDSRIGKVTVSIEHNIDDELVAMSNELYTICECGFGVRGKRKLPKHKDSENKDCTRKRDGAYHLGTAFRTDVAILTFSDISPPEGESDEDLNGLGGYISVLYALIEGVLQQFNIERTEVSGCLLRNGRSCSYVLFDNTPGGAGYVKAITKETIPRIVDAAISVLKSCDCGGPEGNGSCYKCLRNYWNQKYHEILNRGYTLRYLERLREGFEEGSDRI